VEVSVQPDGEQVRIEVSDDGGGFDENAILPGHGLDLLLRRLDTLYPGHSASLLLPVAGGPARVTLLLPAERTGRERFDDEQTSLLSR
jgi:LytS/YehU family sensor histidine kinase